MGNGLLRESPRYWSTVGGVVWASRSVRYLLWSYENGFLIKIEPSPVLTHFIDSMLWKNPPGLSERTLSSTDGIEIQNASVTEMQSHPSYCRLKERNVVCKGNELQIVAVHPHKPSAAF
ncbi:hypothetical protein DPX16_10866 [Anabarilius grahami]|uniref:Uncharacterized protein n=1 Tax=Anabarilius grahami TaxID=495550 RepID=A0A3N0Z7W9_ANAGA|nr:hypothetical protein DPX16_10866 [Anabarilius grahami]